MSNSSFRSTIEIKKSTFTINHHQSILCFGSCFSSNIGELILKSGFHGMVNPFGVLYNPFSISNAIDRIIENKLYSEKNLIESNNLWLSLDHHSSYDKDSAKQTIDAINEEIYKAHQIIQKQPIVLITLGSAHVYKYNKSGRIAGNCHKLPSRNFSKSMLSSDEVTNMLTQTIVKISNVSPLSKIIFTISPVRYLSDGFFENQLSKSILHISISELLKMHPNASYFPAYEIMMDDLRDYRFYSNDMLHPSSLAIDYIWDMFKQTYFSNETNIIESEINELHKALNHRPFQEKSKTYLKFIKSQIDKLVELQNKNPEVNLSELSLNFNHKFDKLNNRND